MPVKPFFRNLRDLDAAVEKEIAKYLDKHLYSGQIFDSAERFIDAPSQIAGKDLVISSAKLGLEKAAVDEKSSSHHVNNTNLHTFVIELSFYREQKKGHYTILTDGWLTSPEKDTDYYMLVWPFAKQDNIIYFKFREKFYPYFTMKDIIKLDYALVSRKAIREYLIQEGFDEKWLNITMANIRKRAAAEDADYYKRRYRNLTFTCSAYLNEKPVNVLIEKDMLFKMAILSGSC